MRENLPAQPPPPSFRLGSSCAAVILSAGASSRMGSPKGLLPLEAESPGHGTVPTVLEYMISVLDQTGFSPILVVIGAGAPRFLSTVRETGFSYVVNERWRNGRTASVKAGLSQLPAGKNGILLWPIDHPFVSMGTLLRLRGTTRERPGNWFVPVHRGQRGHPPLLSSLAVKEVLAYDDGTPLNQYPHTHPAEVVEVPVEDPFVVQNLDTLESFEAARRTFTNRERAPRRTRPD